MRVSALIPTYNRRGYIGRCLQSVLSQSLPVDEIIVVDDGSTDGTAELIQRAAVWQDGTSWFVRKIRGCPLRGAG